MRKDLVIGVTGARGALGRSLVARLRASGHTVLPIPRRFGLLPGTDAFVHLGRDTRRLLARLAEAVGLPRIFVRVGEAPEIPGVRVVRLPKGSGVDAIESALWD